MYPVFFNMVLTFVITDSTSSLQEDLYPVSHEVTQNLMLSNDHSVHVSADSDKTVFNTSNGENESITWQPKQVDLDVTNTLQKAFNSAVASRSNNNSTNGRETRIQNREYP
jgi:hypothetical protein